MKFIYAGMLLNVEKILAELAGTGIRQMLPEIGDINQILRILRSSHDGFLPEVLQFLGFCLAKAVCARVPLFLQNLDVAKLGEQVLQGYAVR